MHQHTIHSTPLNQNPSSAASTQRVHIYRRWAQIMVITRYEFKMQWRRRALLVITLAMLLIAVTPTIVLRHERVHLRQRRRYGMALFAFLYLVPLFPLGLAYGRARLEWEAYAETLRAIKELRGSAALRDSTLRCRIVSRFVGGAYGYMWPFRRQVERWYDRAVTQLESESAST